MSWAAGEPEKCRECDAWERFYSESGKIIDVCYIHNGFRVIEKEVDTYQEKPNWCPLAITPHKWTDEDREDAEAIKKIWSKAYVIEYIPEIGVSAYRIGYDKDFNDGFSIMTSCGILPSLRAYEIATFDEIIGGDNE